MRPLRLELRAFGSFPGTHVVDFESLAGRGLFVVSGPTGAGKTMIFDAMVYALYGQLPGGRAADGEARSHHADAHVETYVQLDFEVDGQRYRVHRTPKWERPKVRGAGTTEQAPTAHLVRMSGHGTEPIATQLSQVTTECTRLVGLDAKQFQRVVLLPQGKFTDFLIASDETREVLLRQLFGGELYEQATKLLRARLDSLEREVGAADEQLRHHRRNAVRQLVTVRDAWAASPAHAAPEGGELGEDELLAQPLPVLLQMADAMAPMRVQHEDVLEAARDSAATLAGRQQVAEQMAARFVEVAALRSHAEQLEARAEAVAALAEAVQASRRARPVVAAHTRLLTAQVDAREAQQALDRLRRAISEAFDALRRPAPSPDPAAVAAAVTTVAQEVQQARTLLTEAARTRAAAERAAAHAAEAQAAHEKAGVVVHEVQEALHAAVERVAQLEPDAGKAVKMQVQLSEASKRLGTRRRLAEMTQELATLTAAADDRRVVYEGVMARFVATQAPRLAAELRDGVPCPVCGSPDHPAKAAQEDGDPVDHHAVDAARADWSAAAAKAGSCATVITSLEESLGEAAGRSVDELEAQELQAADALRAAQLADRALAGAQQGVQELQERLHTARQEEATLGAGVAAAAEAATFTAEAAQAAATAALGFDVHTVEADAGVVESLQRVTDRVAAHFQRADATRSASTVCAEALEAALAEHGFAAAPDAAAVLMAEDDEARSSQQVEQWHEERTHTAGRLAALEELGVPEQAPDVEGATAAAAAAQQRAEAMAAAFTTASNALDAAVEDLAAEQAVAHASATVREARDTARVVFHTCNGESGKRVKLERWVLAAELDRVTAAANEHLARMSTHRYRLARVLGQRGGLTLEVHDAHTGRARSTATLSGGEQFQASLALALGLADVVSRGGTGSGKQFDALFVDEGFGSLDPDALDDAIAALTALQSAGRMVGAITHVEAMKQQLHVGIEVRPLADGRGSTLVVHP